MKIKDNFMLRQIAGTWLVVPVGERVVDFNGMIMLSDSGALLWELLEKGCTYEDMVNAIIDKYDIDDETAKNDINQFLEQLKIDGIAE